MNLQPVTALSVTVTVVYTVLLGWGFSVGARQIWQGFKRPDQLLNPLFANPQAIRIFTFHIVVVSADLFLIGPLSLAHKSELWYWGGRIALFSSSLSLAAFFNRNAESFGGLIGRWVRLRNFFEYGLHILVAAAAVNWFNYYLLLFWLVAYRYLDVGPRRALQTLYNTPAKLAARPWAPTLNWAVITTIYVLTFLAVYNEKVIYAAPPTEATATHVAQPFEVGLVVVLNIAVAMISWIRIKKYTASLPDQRADHPAPA